MKMVRFNISVLFAAVLLLGTMSGCGALLVAGTAAAVSTRPTHVHTTTYVPTTQVVTQVTTRPVAPVTQNITVSAVSSDISYNLDLQAVGNIFGVSSSLEDFERRINSYDAQISNLDLNRDGYVDYLRVVEVQEGYTHLVVLQAVLATNVYQDVATIEVERYGSTNTVTIIGDPYLYGASYVLRPTYVHVPVIYNVFYGPSYRVWHSPYYWGHFPSYYRHRACVHVNVYHQHIHAHNKNYHHTYHYIDDYRPRYEGIRNTVSRNDYATAHPEESFSRRNTEVRNARDIQVENTRRTAVKATDAVRKEVSSSSSSSSSSSRRVSSTAASKVTTTTSGSSSSRRTSTDSTPATSTTVKSEATSSTSRRTSTTTSSAATTAPKVTTTTTGTSTSRRTSTSSTPATSTTTKSETGSSSSRRTTSSTAVSTTTAPKVTTSSTSSSRRSSTASTPQKASSASKAAMTSGSSSVKASSSVRRSSSSSVRSASTSSSSSRSTETTTSTRSSGSRR